jgi:hypothetical protein
MGELVGKKIWVFPDAELPQPGTFIAKGHESIIILNLNARKAVVSFTLYFQDQDPLGPFEAVIEDQRVKCIRMDDPDNLNGCNIDCNRQYAIKLESDVPIVAQYGRLDTSDQPMAFYTTMGYSC